MGADGAPRSRPSHPISPVTATNRNGSGACDREGRLEGRGRGHEPDGSQRGIDLAVEAVVRI